MAKGLPRSRSRGAPGLQSVLKQAIKFTNVPFNATGATGVGWGTAVVGDFPAGNIALLGAVAYVRITATAAATGVAATFDGDYSLGTTPTADATLSGTDVNIVPSAALGAAVAGVSPVARSASAAPGAILDNTDGSLEINLNVLIDDANISADAQAMTASGVVYILYSVLGDD